MNGEHHVLTTRKLEIGHKFRLKRHSDVTKVLTIGFNISCLRVQKVVVVIRVMRDFIGCLSLNPKTMPRR